jgi:hypothetical protein
LDVGLVIVAAPVAAWVSGALRMSRNSFLIWNAIAAIASRLVTVFGARLDVPYSGRGPASIDCQA